MLFEHQFLYIPIYVEIVGFVLTNRSTDDQNVTGINGFYSSLFRPQI